jgi:hypothetical protein
MENRIYWLNVLGIETEFYKYSNLGHGFRLGIGTSAECWFDDAIYLWKKEM